MNIKDFKITEIKPYAKNPRRNDEAVKYVAESIRRFGFKVPIVIDKDNVIVAGHTRFKAAKKLKLEEVPCIIADDLTEEQIKAFRLADNKVAEKAEWDFELLGEELDEILNIDMEMFGFDFRVDEEEKEVVEDDFEAELPEEPKAKLGDVYQLGRHRLMCGDSTSVDDIDKLTNGERIVLFLSDPPYGIDIVKGNSVGGCGELHFGSVGGCKIVKTNSYIPIKGDDTTETAQMNYDIVSQIFFRQKPVGLYGIKKTQATLPMLNLHGHLLTKGRNCTDGCGMVCVEKAKEVLKGNQEYIQHRNQWA